MKYITILFAITFSYSITKAKDINNEIGVYSDISIIHGKPAGFIGLGISTNYNLNFHKYLSWGNEFVINHGFRLGYNAVAYGVADIMVNYVKKNPISTNNIIFSSFLIGNLFIKNNNTLSVGLGITTRANFDKCNFYYGTPQMDPITGEDKIINYYYEKKIVTNLGWGLITNISYKHVIKENLSFNTEFGWRGYIGELNKKNYSDRASGSGILYFKFGCIFNLKNKK
ncbi:MAG: hypothetical protein R2760_01835 [Chitinophagales bacterium]